jgi:hypothetical protein
MKNLAITFAALRLIALKSYQVSSQEKQRHLSNTEAFTKLYGYIRFFHPSDEAQKIDWERFAVFGMQKVYDAGSTEQLREALIKLFLPIAPTLEIDSVATLPGYEKTSFMPPDVSNLKKVYWQHSGVFLWQDLPQHRLEDRLLCRTTVADGRDQESPSMECL